MPATKTPLRYPGGKSQLTKFVAHTIRLNKIKNTIYCEPFSGGAGVAMDLLLSKEATSIILNDYDIAIYSFWNAILTETERFIETIRSTPITLSTWHQQKEIYTNLIQKDSPYNFDLAFATFFLNRTNRAGIITGGPIGGFKQASNYSIDCRFNTENLIKKINLIASNRNRIELYNMDANDLINKVLLARDTSTLFTFFDPPYYRQGKNLYTNFFNDEDHVTLSDSIRHMNNYHWIATYDNEHRIEEIYNGISTKKYMLQYTASTKRKEQELFFQSPITSVESFDKVIFQDT